ncbi:MAG: helix-turn-helix transcriptional regulator [Eubacteriales bacterium]
MYKNKSSDGRNNISGLRIKELREKLPNSPSQKQFADMLQIAGLDLDKNAIQRIEAGSRFVTDIELKVFVQVLNTTYEKLLD